MRGAGIDARLALLGGALSLAVFALLVSKAWGGGSFAWDATVADFIADVMPVSDEEVHIDPFIDAITLAVGALMAFVVVRLLLRRRYRAALFPVAAVAGASLLSVIVKAAVDRPAIETADGSGASFPSGTATWSMAAVAALVLLAPLSRRLLFGLAGAAFVFALGAVIAWEEWHYPSDVLAGWCLALAWVASLWLALFGRRDAGRTG